MGPGPPVGLCLPHPLLSPVAAVAGQLLMARTAGTEMLSRRPLAEVAISVSSIDLRTMQLAAIDET